jgi:hypothetical protein
LHRFLLAVLRRYPRHWWILTRVALLSLIGNPKLATAFRSIFGATNDLRETTPGYQIAKGSWGEIFRDGRGLYSALVIGGIAMQAVFGGRISRPVGDGESIKSKAGRDEVGLPQHQARIPIRPISGSLAPPGLVRSILVAAAPQPDAKSPSTAQGIWGYGQFAPAFACRLPNP